MARSDDQLTARTSELDVLYAEKPQWLVIGPIAPVSDAALADTLNRIAGIGLESRMALMPSRNGRRWRVVSDPGDSAVLPACEVPCGSLEEVVAHAVNRHPDMPIGVWRCGAYLCLYYDHGLGDASFNQRVLAALTDPAAVNSFRTAGDRFTRHPLAASLWVAARTSPTRLLTDTWRVAKALVVRVHRSSGSRSAHDEAQGRDGHGSTGIAGEAPTTLLLASGPTFLDDLREYRDRAHPGVSTTTLVMYALCASLQSAGLNVSPDVDVLADLRRFLPKSVVTFGNFVAVIAVPFGIHITPREFGESLKEEVTSYRPLVKVALIAAVSRLRYARRRRPVTVKKPRVPSDSLTAVTITDHSKFPADAQLRWSNPTRARMAIVIEPASRQHIAIVLSSSGDKRLQLTARFYGSHVEPQVVNTALSRVLKSDFASVIDGQAPTAPAERVKQ